MKKSLIRYGLFLSVLCLALKANANLSNGGGGSGSSAIGGTVTSGTEGSVLVLGPGGVLAQDNSKFFYDLTNDLLGLGTASPTGNLEINDSSGASMLLVAPDASVDSYIAISTFTGSGAGVGYIMRRGPTSATSAGHMQIYQGGAGPLTLGAGPTGTILSTLAVSTNSRVGIGTTNPSYTLDVAGVVQSTGIILSGGSAPIFQTTHTALSVQLTDDTDNDFRIFESSSQFNGMVISTPTATMVGFLASPQPVETIADGATITANVCGGVKMISSAGAVTTNTTNTFTAPSAATAGCWFILFNVGSNNIVLDTNANFATIGAANITMTPNDVVFIAGTASVWGQATALSAL
jgi:hypothetical protein